MTSRVFDRVVENHVRDVRRDTQLGHLGVDLHFTPELTMLLFVEPRLIGNLDVVSIRVADVCREVVGTPFGPKARFLV